MNKKSVWIVIPVGKREKYLEQLLNNLEEYSNNIIFINNFKGYKKFDNVHHIEDFDEVNIHRWWNKGIDYAKSQGAEYVVIMNDDISFSKTLIQNMINKMIERNSDVCGIAKHAGVLFIINSKSNIRADENLRWWCGDGDIFRQALEKKSLTWYVDESFNHYELNKQTSSSEYLLDLGNKDLIYYKEKLTKLGQTKYWNPTYEVN